MSDLHDKSQVETSQPKPPDLQVLLNISQSDDADIEKDFDTLTAAVEALAKSLDRHIKSRRPFQHSIAVLSESCDLIRGVSKDTWKHHAGELFQGAIWSRLMGTIFSSPFYVFGIRAQHLAQEWGLPTIEPRAEVWRCLTVHSLQRTAGVAQNDRTSPLQPSNILKALLGHRHSLQHSVLHSGINHENLKDADADARDAIHQARMILIDVLDALARLFAAQGLFTKQIEDVVTSAQILALKVAAQLDPYTLFYRSIEESKKENENIIPKGQMALIARPGLRKWSISTNPYFGKFSDIVSPKIIQSSKLDNSSDETILSPPITAPSGLVPPKGLLEIKAVDDATGKTLDDAMLAIWQGVERAMSSLSRNFTISYDKNIAKDLGSYALVRGVPNLYWNTEDRKRMLVESAIWSILLETVFDTPFAIFGDAASATKIGWTTPHGPQWPFPTKDSEKARQQYTRKLLEHAFERKDLSGPIGRSHTAFRVSVINRIKACSTLLGPAASLHRRIDPKVSAIENLVHHACYLALQMALAAPRLRVECPRPGDPYVEPQGSHHPTMDKIQECAHIKEGQVSFIVRPGLSRYGNMSGTDLNKHTLLSKAESVHIIRSLVCISPRPEAPEEEIALPENSITQTIPPPTAALNDAAPSTRPRSGDLLEAELKLIDQFLQPNLDRVYQDMGHVKPPIRWLLINIPRDSTSRRPYVVEYDFEFLEDISESPIDVQPRGDAPDDAGADKGKNPGVGPKKKVSIFDVVGDDEEL
ncbi:hypothetical protein BDV95DRAFT_611295 [Massariosphaeria phaeospora]|uniref:Uncharacterized protein n=1 Tax=Massariosphaeria phaeospora TaxID=100035 RepID=A0A7C8I4M1_9PLEO|nr:hypothetical protein BDV95DRAFT_611295 [Massariosphaeria phaeospora]